MIGVFVMTLNGGNEIWRRFIVMKMPDWLAWLKTIHLPSHIRLWHKYVNITLPQKAYASIGNNTDEEQLLSTFFVPSDDFWNQMELEVGSDNSPKMYKLSLSLTMDDFLHDLTLYAQQFSEIREIYAFMVQHKNWFDQLLNYLRSGLYQQWKQESRLS